MFGLVGYIFCFLHYDTVTIKAILCWWFSVDAYLTMPWLISMDLQSFEILFEFESDDSDSIRLESDGLIQNFWINRTCRRTTTHAHSSTKNFNCCAIVIEIYLMLMVLCLHGMYTLASTVRVIVQYCLRNQENLHISVCNNVSCSRVVPGSTQ